MPREGFRAEVTFELGFGGRIRVLQVSKTGQRTFLVRVMCEIHERLGLSRGEPGKLNWSSERQVKFYFILQARGNYQRVGDTSNT